MIESTFLFWPTFTDDDLFELKTWSTQQEFWSFYQHTTTFGKGYSRII